MKNIPQHENFEMKSTFKATNSNDIVKLPFNSRIKDIFEVQ